jgi:hypothetical protein
MYKLENTQMAHKVIGDRSKNVKEKNGTTEKSKNASINEGLIPVARKNGSTVANKKTKVD